MRSPPHRHDEPVPLRALLLSLAALAVPAAVALADVPVPPDYEALLWLLLLVPAFLLAYHRGWRGAATALAAGMATLSLTQTLLVWLERPVPDLLLGVVVAYTVLVLCVGWFSEAFHVELDRAHELAFTDPLTGLPNRRHATVFLEEALAAAERGRGLSVVLFDLDDFKEFNDRHGHQAGDRALEDVGAVLAGQTRAMDLTARYGGEEFLSVLADTDARGGVAFAHRVRDALAASSLSRRNVTASAGVAAYRSEFDTVEELVDAADRALYRAKRAGRNQVWVDRKDRPEGDDEEIVGGDAGG